MTLIRSFAGSARQATDTSSRPLAADAAVGRVRAPLRIAPIRGHVTEPQPLPSRSRYDPESFPAKARPGTAGRRSAKGVR